MKRASRPDMNRRQFLGTATGAAFAGGLSLAGCTTNPAGGGSNTVTQWYHQYGEAGTRQAVQRYAEGFEKKHPDINLDVTWTPGDYQQKLSAARISGSDPDVYEDSGITLQMVKQKQAIPLDDLLSDEARSDFNPNDLEQFTVDGKLYGIKMVTDIGLLYYRTSMLEGAGVAPPTTMDEVIAAATKLTTNERKGLFLGNDNGINAMRHVLPWSNNATFIQDDKVLIDSDEVITAIAKLRELNETDSLLLGYTTDYFDPSAFTQGATAMQWTGLWAMPQIQDELGDDFGVMPWPKLDASGTPATFQGGWAAMVNGNSDKIEAAKQVINWMWVDNTEIQRDFNLSYGFHLPPRKSIHAQATKLQSGPAKQAIDALEKYGNFTPPTWNEKINALYVGALSRIVKKDADVEAELKEASNKAQTELDKLLG